MASKETKLLSMKIRVLSALLLFSAIFITYFLKDSVINNVPPYIKSILTLAIVSCFALYFYKKYKPVKHSTGVTKKNMMVSNSYVGTKGKFIESVRTLMFVAGMFLLSYVLSILLLNIVIISGSLGDKEYKDRFRIIGVDYSKGYRYQVYFKNKLVLLPTGRNVKNADLLNGDNPENYQLIISYKRSFFKSYYVTNYELVKNLAVAQLRSMLSYRNIDYLGSDVSYFRLSFR